MELDAIKLVDQVKAKSIIVFLVFPIDKNISFNRSLLLFDAANREIFRSQICSELLTNFSSD